MDSVQTGLKTLFFSFEVPKEAFTLKMISYLTRIDLSKLQDKTFLTEKERLSVKEVCNKMKHFNSTFVEASGMNLSKLKTIILNIYMKDGLDFIIIDYLGLIKIHNYNKFLPEHIEISQIVSELKQLSCQLNIPILLLAQLSRSFEQQQGAPTLSNLKSSGGVEEHSDNVIFLIPNDKNSSEVEALIAKQRNGPKGSFELIFRPEWSLFELKN